MKKTFFVSLLLFWQGTIAAQPRPYEIDPSFIPPLSFLQKTWTGQYDAWEPNSKKILTITRKLLLRDDLSYVNETHGFTRESAVIVLKHETGNYSYDEETGIVSYTIKTDSTVDINEFLQGMELNYKVNKYTDTEPVKTYTELAQFTYAAREEARQWVFFDSQLKSVIDQTKQAVYVMIGAKGEDGIASAYRPPHENVMYDLQGRPYPSHGRGIFIIAGKKVYLK